jgi:Putative auto-transporter adhesin, head GIN domain
MTALAIMGLLVCCASLSAQQWTIYGSGVNATTQENYQNYQSGINMSAQQWTIYGSGRIIEASLLASNFNRVDMAAIGNVHLKRDNREELRIKVDDNLLPYFKTKVVDGVLVIYIDPPVSLQPTRAEIYLSVQALQEIRLSGIGKIEAPNLDADQFAVALTGTGNVAMSNFDATRLTVWMSGTGNVIISGRMSGEVDVDEQVITMQGTGNYQAGNLTSTKAAIRLDGIGKADLQVSDILQATLSGIGTIRYRGHPRQVETSVSGLGNIIAVN